jgi:hypothetical protein
VVIDTTGTPLEAVVDRIVRDVEARRGTPRG